MEEKIRRLIEEYGYNERSSKVSARKIVALFNKEKLAWLKEVAPKQNELNYDLSSPFDAHWHNGSCAYEKQLFTNAEKSLK